MPMRSLLALLLSLALLAACGAPTPPADDDTDPIGDDPGAGPFALTVGSSSAMPGTVVTLTFPDVIGAAEVTFDGRPADVVVSLTAAADAATRSLDVIVPAGTIGYPTIVVDDGQRSAVLEGDARAFFAGGELLAAADLAAVQAALDAAPEGTALRVPAGPSGGGAFTGGSLTIDNVVLYGPADEPTRFEGLTSVSLLVRGPHVAGIADAEIGTARITTYGGRSPVTSGLDADLPRSSNQGTLRFHDVVLTGPGATPATFDATTGAVTGFAAATGEFDHRAGLAALDFLRATLLFEGIYSQRSEAAIGSWTLVDSEIVASNYLQINQAAGDIVLRRSRMAVAGDPGPGMPFVDRLYVRQYSGALTLIDGALASTVGMSLDATYGGAFHAERSTLHAVGAIDLPRDGATSTDLRDSRVSTGGQLRIRIDSGTVAIDATTLTAGANLEVSAREFGDVAVAGSTIVAGGSVAFDLDQSGSIAIEDSRLEGTAVYVEASATAAISVAGSELVGTTGNVEATLDEGTIVLRDTTFDAFAEARIYAVSGAIALSGVTIDARNARIDQMQSVVLTIVDTDIRVTSSLEIRPASNGVVAVTLRNGTFEAGERIEFRSSTGRDTGDWLLEDVTVTARTQPLIVQSGGGALTIRRSTLQAKGEDVLAADLELGSRRNLTRIEDTTILGADNVWIVNDDDRLAAPDPLAPGPNDIVLLGVTIDARDDMLDVLSHGDLIVGGGSVLSALQEIRLVSPYGLVDTTGSTLTSPTVTIDGKEELP